MIGYILDFGLLSQYLFLDVRHSVKFVDFVLWVVNLLYTV